jgi:hypothetical protein
VQRILRTDTHATFTLDPQLTSLQSSQLLSRTHRGAAAEIKSSVCWVLTRRYVVWYRRFGTTWPWTVGPLRMGPTGSPETSVSNTSRSVTTQTTEDFTQSRYLSSTRHVVSRKMKVRLIYTRKNSTTFPCRFSRISRGWTALCANLSYRISRKLDNPLAILIMTVLSLGRFSRKSKLLNCIKQRWRIPNLTRIRQDMSEAWRQKCGEINVGSKGKEIPLCR